jgi:hypothetical protein
VSKVGIHRKDETFNIVWQCLCLRLFAFWTSSLSVPDSITSNATFQKLHVFITSFKKRETAPIQLAPLESFIASRPQTAVNIPSPTYTTVTFQKVLSKSQLDIHMVNYILKHSPSWNPDSTGTWSATAWSPASPVLNSCTCKHIIWQKKDCRTPIYWPVLDTMQQYACAAFISLQFHSQCTLKKCYYLVFLIF